jgi:N6-adenosine-specific RNA methylase IME4/ParB-like chromosome segregation protein Spo0J
MKPDAAEAMDVSAIKVGARHRRELGDIASLARSIERLGLLHPVVVTPDGRLIAGERRLEAYKMLGRTEIPVTEVDLEEIARGELAENSDRLNFLPSEIEAIRRTLEPIEKAAAKARQGARNDLRENFPDVGEQRARDRIGAFAGVSGRTVEKIAAIVEAAEAEPERFGKLRDDMDRSGRVEAPYRRLKIIRQAEAIRKEPPPLPQRGPYRVIVADPPWPYELRQEDPSHRAIYSYPTMSIAQISALDSASIAHQDCILWLWTTNHHMREAFEVLDAWGFTQKTILTWLKDRMSTGDWLRGQSEHCLMAVRGKPVVHLTNQTTLLHGKVRRHSEKPEEFYALVERLCPAPRYAELFSRHKRKGWDGHGDEHPEHCDLEAGAAK